MDIQTVAAGVLAVLLSTSSGWTASAEMEKISPAASSVRDAMIDRIELAYAQETMLTADSPLVKVLLAPARSANPSLSKDDLADLASEVGSSLSTVFMERGGIYDTLLRISLAPLSESELERLEALLSDPVFRKFHTSMASPTSQQKMLQAVMTNTARMTAAINEILVKRGLKEVH